MQHLQLLTNGSDGSKDCCIQLDNPRGHWCRACSYEFDSKRDNSNFVHLEFHGSYILDVFVEWLTSIERLLEYHDVSEERK